MGFESFQPVPAEQPNIKNEEAIEAELPEKEMTEEQMKDFLFDQYLKQQLIEEFFTELRAYLNDEAIDAMRGELAEHEDDEVYATIGLPNELRERKFEAFEKAIESGKDPAELMREFVGASVRMGFGIGYHTSPNDIRPKESGEWTILGTEKDHRDDDLSKAYYSTKYRHLFKKKDPKFIYIVRTDADTHRTDGNWSRAGKLSVVTRVPFASVVEYVENTVRDIQKNKKQAP